MQGEPGQGAASGAHPSADNAIKDFEKKFKDKTKNNWADRDNFVAQKGKYTLIEVDGDAEAEVKVTTVPLLCPPSPVHRVTHLDWGEIRGNCAALFTSTRVYCDSVQIRLIVTVRLQAIWEFVGQMTIWGI